MNEMSESLCCFLIIALTTTIVAIGDLIARAFFYDQEQQFASFLPLLIGSIALCALGLRRKNQKNLEDTAHSPNTSGIRRVRVTGPVK